MKHRWIWGALTSLSLVAGNPDRTQAEWLALKWMERPSAHGPSTQAGPEDRIEFLPVLSFDKQKCDESGWRTIKSLLTEGDVIAYRKETWEARKEIFLQGKLNAIGYRLLKYGHLAMVVKDPNDERALRLLSSESFKGPNIGADLDSLQHYSWDVYRLNCWDRVDKKRLYEFIGLVRQKAERWYGYDFSGMFGLWNSNLDPRKPEQIGHDYICSTLILAALQYAGVELDAYQRHGIADIVTPLQIVNSKGRLIAPKSSESNDRPTIY
jgi:hypothetical protein